MGNDDIKADIAAVNLYNRMLNSDSGNLFDVYTEYNNGVVNGEINESLEFLEYYGNGNAEDGMKNIKERIKDTSIGTDLLDKGVNEQAIKDCESRFLEYLSQESGISI